MNLEEIEAVKQLKARYFRYLDTKEWEKWGDVFTEDAELVNPGARNEPLKGRELIVRTVSTNLKDIVSVHHGHMPEIEILGPDSARGVWAMYDMLLGRRGGASPDQVLFEGWGHYIENYRKGDDGRWRIARLQLMRLHTRSVQHTRNVDQSVYPDA